MEVDGGIRKKTLKKGWGRGDTISLQQHKNVNHIDVAITRETSKCTIVSSIKQMCSMLVVAAVLHFHQIQNAQMHQKEG